MADTKTRTATEVSAVTALAVAVGFAFSGAWFAALTAGAIGVVLFAVYEYMEVDHISLSEEEIEQISEKADETLDNFREDDN